MVNYTDGGLYLWNKTDPKITTIEETAKSMQKIGDYQTNLNNEVKIKSNPINKAIGNKITVNQLLGTQGAEGSVSVVKDAGFKTIRTEIDWDTTEVQKGIYTFNGTWNTDNNVAEILDNGFMCIVMLKNTNNLGGHPLYPNSINFETQAAIDGFANFVKATVQHHVGKGIIWEVWNEPSDTINYMGILQAVSPIIRQYDPSGFILAPNLDSINVSSLSKLETYIQNGLLGLIDGLSTHHYQTTIPEDDKYDQIRKLLLKYNRMDIPIFSTEWGYSLYNGFDTPLTLTEQQQANYFSRMVFIQLFNGIYSNIWHMMFNTSNENSTPTNTVTYQEANFGLIRNDKTTQKPNFIAAKTLGTQLKDFYFVRKLPSLNGDWVLLLKNKNNNYALVYWNTDPGANKTLSLLMDDVGEGTIVDMAGTKTDTTWTNELTITLTESPKIILFYKTLGSNGDNINLLYPISKWSSGYQSGWSDYNTDKEVGIYRDVFGFIHMRGASKNAVVSNNTICFNVPFKPAKETVLYQGTDNGVIRFVVVADGTCFIQGGGDGKSIYFDGIVFK